MGKEGKTYYEAKDEAAASDKDRERGLGWKEENHLSGLRGNQKN